MAEYLKSLKELKVLEGWGETGYVNDPDDPGQETYNGIARGEWPEWEGWPIVDDRKKKGFAIACKQLDDMAIEFFKSKFWDYFGLDTLANQDLANEIFEQSVNLGRYRTAYHVQYALNKLNRAQRWYPDVTEDFRWGPNTRGTMDTFLRRGKSKRLIRILNCLQGGWYLGLMDKKERFEKYAGWFDRI